MDRTGSVAFAFGMPPSLLSNHKIKIRTKAEMLNRGAIAYTQHDVPLEAGPNVTVIEESDGPPPTLRIAQGAAQWARDNELTTLVIICAGPHAWRCGRDMKEALKKNGLDHIKILMNPSGDIGPCFYKDSEQPWTRTWYQWYFRETILRLMPFWLYAKIAG